MPDLHAFLSDRQQDVAALATIATTLLWLGRRIHKGVRLMRTSAQEAFAKAVGREVAEHMAAVVVPITKRLDALSEEVVSHGGVIAELAEAQRALHDDVRQHMANEENR